MFILHLIGPILPKKILPKVQAPKIHKKERMAGCIEAELSTEGF